MTIEDRLKNEVAFGQQMGEMVYSCLFEVYRDLAENHVDRQIPILNDVIEYTYGDMYMEVRDDLIAESIERKDHELYHMSLDQYTLACYSGNLDDIAIAPHIPMNMFRSKIIEAINNSRLFLEDEGHFENQPILEVW